MSKLLSQLLTSCGQALPFKECQLNDLRLDSRAVKPGDVFCAVQGHDAHGVTYVSQAIDSGAAVILSDCQLPADILSEIKGVKGVQIFIIAELKSSLGMIAHEFYSKPSEQLKVLAVTGTNGKTSVAWFMMQALNKRGERAGYIGTLGAGLLNDMVPMINTTPGVFDVHRLMAEFVNKGATFVCMEVSSHALEQNRIDGLLIHQALFTNLSRDHLDYHQTMEQYALAKFKLFGHFDSQQAIINADDSCGQKWLNQNVNSKKMVSYGINHEADWRGEQIKSDENGLSFVMGYGTEKLTIHTRLMGLFNVENLLLVAAGLNELSVPLKEIESIINGLQAVPGRMVVVDLQGKNILDSKQATWVVDYAHTPDALSSVLSSLRGHVKGKLYCVFGCGGDRDKGKRSLMGQAAESLADVVVVTDDNPRFEAPEEIVDGILSGMYRGHEVIHQRKQALKHVKQLSQSGDVVLVAGKGHEDYQEIKGERLDFNDAQTIREIHQVAA